MDDFDDFDVYDNADLLEVERDLNRERKCHDPVIGSGIKHFRSMILVIFIILK
jgi:hypothetical protein